jgi:hypothetical protein
MLRLVAAFVLAGLAATTAAAQCSDPAMPPGGFAITNAIDQAVTYSDAYRTRADVRWPTTAPGPCGWPMICRPIHASPMFAPTSRTRRWNI